MDLWPTFCELRPVGGHQGTDCSQQCCVPQGHCPRRSGGALQTNTNLTILPKTRVTLQWYSTLLSVIRRLVPSYRTHLNRRLAKDPTQAVTRKNILFLKKSTLAEEVCKRLIPRVQNPRGRVDSSGFLKRRSFLGRMSRRPGPEDLDVYSVRVCPGVHNNTRHNKKFLSLYCSPCIIMVSE